jgi:hypothetical protein
MLKKSLMILSVLVGVGCVEQDVNRTPRGVTPAVSTAVADGAKVPAKAQDAGVRPVDAAVRPLDASRKVPDVMVLPTTTVPVPPASAPPLSVLDASPNVSQDSN